MSLLCSLLITSTGLQHPAPASLCNASLCTFILLECPRLGACCAQPPDQLLSLSDLHFELCPIFLWLNRSLFVVLVNVPLFGFTVNLPTRLLQDVLIASCMFCCPLGIKLLEASRHRVLCGCTCPIHLGEMLKGVCGC